MPQSPSKNRSIYFVASPLFQSYFDSFHIVIPAKLRHMEKLDKNEILLIKLL